GVGRERRLTRRDWGCKQKSAAVSGWRPGRGGSIISPRPLPSPGRRSKVRPRERCYRCAVCAWQGQVEPLAAGAAPPGPRPGVYLSPLSWGQPWGLALLLVAACVGLVVAAAFFLR